MKIAIVGSDQRNSIENSYVKYLREAGCEVSHYPSQTKFYAFYNKNILNKLIFKLGFSNIYKVINKQLLDFIQSDLPEVAWVFKGMEILPSTLKLLKEKNIYLVNYNADNPFIFSGKGSGNANITKSIPIYDLHVSYNLETIRILKSDFRKPVGWVPFGFDISASLYEQLLNSTEINKVCFVGNPDIHRAKLITGLAEKGISVDVYGNDWGKWIKNPNVIANAAIYGNEFYEALRRYRIQLNPLRPHNRNSHCMRTFEVPAVGGIMLAESTYEHNYFFKEGDEAFFYRDIDECCSKIRYIQSMTEKEAMAIREKARKRCIEGGYDYKNRAVCSMRIISKYYGK